MGKFLKSFMKVVQTEYIPPNAWDKIIEEADKETLDYLQDEGFETIKYFTRDDWMDAKRAEDIKDKVHSRINEDWFNKRF